MVRIPLARSQGVYNVYGIFMYGTLRTRVILAFDHLFLCIKFDKIFDQIYLKTHYFLFVNLKIDILQ